MVKVHRVNVHSRKMLLVKLVSVKVQEVNWHSLNSDSERSLDE